MSGDFLLELRSEEIPARMQAGARAELEKLFRAELRSRGVVPGAVTVWSTPRRLALIARDLPLVTDPVREEIKGPRTSAPAAALEGFLRKTGLTAAQLSERDGVWFAVKDIPGIAIGDVLRDVIVALVRGFSWPKSQRWGAASRHTDSLRWVRPLQGIVALLDGEVIGQGLGAQFDGIEPGRETFGHRFHHAGPIVIDGVDDYAPKLHAAHVIVDQATREAIIRDGAHRLAAEAGLELVADEALVIENAGLTEWPVPLLGRFDPAFLAVPPEVIQLTTRINQKYFIATEVARLSGAGHPHPTLPLEGEGFRGLRLANAFVCTANIAAHDGGAAIVAGNGKVLAARLADARFFWEQDQKTPLADHATKLARITFHDKLGSLADKVARVADLAEWLAQQGVVPGADPAQARLAAELCKADLVTDMVGEFPELQGIMGGYYARAEGLPAAVADAIRDHYQPAGPSDPVPAAPVSVALALADKLDTLRGFFAINEKPTGSKDPFALRRAALGAIRLITANALRLSVAEGDLLAFFAERLKVQQREAGVRHDLIDAVLAQGGEGDLVRLLARVKALQAFVGSEDGINLLAGYKRAANILKRESWEPQAQDYVPEPAETALAAALAAAAPRVDGALGDEDFTAAMAALAGLRAPIDAFFETVTVNDADANKRANRLDLLDRFRAAVHKVADFSRIEG